MAKESNVILISIDCLRADHVGCYGYGKNTTPNIDTLASNGCIFLNAFSHDTQTTPTHASILTSLYPLTHNVVKSEKLDDSALTLPKFMKSKGYATAGFISGERVKSVFGFGRGFDLYDDKIGARPKYDDEMGLEGRTAANLTSLTLNWMEKNVDKKFFIFMHYFDAHNEYKPPPEFDRFGNATSLGFDTKFKTLEKISQGKLQITERQLSQIISLYDGEISYVDHCIGELIEKLKELKLFDNTLIAVTADHGEAFLEHGFMQHSNIPYDELIHIPLVMHLPHTIRKGIKVQALTQQIDIFPTIADIVFREIPQNLTGKSAFNLIRGEHEKTNSAVFCQSTHYKELYCIRTENWKYIYFPNNRQELLFDMSSDPGELINLAEAKGRTKKLLKRELFGWKKAYKREVSEKNKVKLDEKIKKRLKALGYL